MKFQVDGVEVFELNEIKKKVIMNDIDADIFGADMKRRVKYIIEHKYERCFDRLKKEWEPKLKKKGVASIPLDDDAFSTLVFSQTDYEDRKIRSKKEKTLGGQT